MRVEPSDTSTVWQYLSQTYRCLVSPAAMESPHHYSCNSRPDNGSQTARQRQRQAERTEQRETSKHAVPTQTARQTHQVFLDRDSVSDPGRLQQGLSVGHGPVLMGDGAHDELPQRWCRHVQGGLFAVINEGDVGTGLQQQVHNLEGGEGGSRGNYSTRHTS